MRKEFRFNKGRSIEFIFDLTCWLIGGGISIHNSISIFHLNFLCFTLLYSWTTEVKP